MNLSFNEETHRLRNEYTRRDALNLSNPYTYTNPAFLFHMQERERAILKSLKKVKIDLSKSKVLEVGCGNGHILQRFLEFGAKEAVGVDLMENRLRYGKERYTSIQFLQADGAHLPLLNEQFDLVMQFTCMSSILNFQMREQLAQEMWRVLRPGGTILFYDVRPTPFAVRALLKIYGYTIVFLRALKGVKKKIQISSESVQHPTPIKPFEISEIQSLFSKGEMLCQSLSLDFKLSRVAEKSYGLAMLLSYLPFLRVNYLAIIRKPVFLNKKSYY